MLDASTLATIVALIVACFALLVALAQVTQQYVGTGQLLRICDTTVFAGAPGGGHRVWIGRQFRFRVIYQLPCLALPYNWSGQSELVPAPQQLRHTFPDIIYRPKRKPYSARYWLRMFIPRWESYATLEKVTHSPGEASWISFVRTVQMNRAADIEYSMIEDDADRCPSDLPVVPMPVSLRDIIVLALKSGFVITAASFENKYISMQSLSGAITSTIHPILGPLIHFTPAQKSVQLDTCPKTIDGAWMSRLWGVCTVSGHYYGSVKRRQVERMAGLHERNFDTTLQRADEVPEKRRRKGSKNRGRYAFNAHDLPESSKFSTVRRPEDQLDLGDDRVFGSIPRSANDGLWSFFIDTALGQASHSHSNGQPTESRSSVSDYGSDRSRHYPAKKWHQRLLKGIRNTFKVPLGPKHIEQAAVVHSQKADSLRRSPVPTSHVLAHEQPEKVQSTQTPPGMPSSPESAPDLDATGSKININNQEDGFGTDSRREDEKSVTRDILLPEGTARSQDTTSAEQDDLSRRVSMESGLPPEKNESSDELRLNDDLKPADKSPLDENDNSSRNEPKNPMLLLTWEPNWQPFVTSEDGGSMSDGGRRFSRSSSTHVRRRSVSRARSRSRGPRNRRRGKGWREDHPEEYPLGDEESSDEDSIRRPQGERETRQDRQNRDRAMHTRRQNFLGPETKPGPDFAWFWASQADILPGYWASPWKGHGLYKSTCYGAVTVVIEAMTNFAKQGTNFRYHSYEPYHTNGNQWGEWLRSDRHSYPGYAINARSGVIVGGMYDPVRFKNFEDRMPPIELMRSYEWQTDSTPDYSAFEVEMRTVELLQLDSWLSFASRTGEILRSKRDLIHTTPKLVDQIMNSFSLDFDHVELNAIEGGHQLIQEIAANLLDMLADQALSDAEQLYVLVALLRTAKYAFCLLQGPGTEDVLDFLFKDMQVHFV